MTNRRQFLMAAGLAAGASTLPVIAKQAAASREPDFSVRIALNTGTIMGQKLTIEQQVDVAAKAGYDGIEPWIRDLEAFISSGGDLDTLRKHIRDAGLTVDSAIGFAEWLANDATVRREGLEQARHDMELVKAIGGTRIAAPPSGVRGSDELPELPAIAARYRALLEIGDEVGVVPQLELWGHSPVISKLEQLAYVATAASHPNACVLADFYHIYKGGNDFAALLMIEASRMHCFHINDYPATPLRDRIGDQDRVFPGDGVCPLPAIIAQLIGNGFRGTFSLELFNPGYWKRDALEIAEEGLRKSRAVVRTAFIKDSPMRP